MNCWILARILTSSISCLTWAYDKVCCLYNDQFPLLIHYDDLRDGTWRLPLTEPSMSCLNPAHEIRGYAKSLEVPIRVTCQARVAWSNTKRKNREMIPMFVTRDDHVTTARCCIVGFARSHYRPFVLVSTLCHLHCSQWRIMGTARILVSRNGNSFHDVLLLW